jgi:hypothetical protein
MPDMKICDLNVLFNIDPDLAQDFFNVLVYAQLTNEPLQFSK